MVEILLIVLAGLIVTVSLKAILLGSDFSFLHWYRHGQRYINWYNFLRPTFEEYLTEEEIKEFK